QRGLPGPPRARRALQRLPRRHEPPEHQEPPGQVGRRFPHREDLHRVVGEPLRRPPGEQELRPALETRLPDLPHAAGLRPAAGPPGTPQPLPRDGKPLPPLSGSPKNDGPVRNYFSHHFIGGNSYLDRMVGADVDEYGSPESYPQLSVFSFSSADPKSPYHNAY